MGEAKLEGLTRVLKLRSEIKDLIERGEFKSIQQFDPSPSLADIITYYEYLDLCNENQSLSSGIKNECSSIKDIENRLKIFIDPKELFERTYLSENMDDIIIKVFAGILGVDAIRKDGSITTLRSRIIILPSLMGGGKTHLLITLSHIMRLYNELVVERGDLKTFKETIKLLDENLAERLYEIAGKTEHKRIRLAAIDGTSEKTAPDPIRPIEKAIFIHSGNIKESYKVYTLWGIIAHYFGNYPLMAKRDGSNTVPSKEELKKLLSGSPFIIMVDEPLVYLSRYGDNEKLRDFFQVLTIAIKELNNGILILSIPISQDELIDGGVKGAVREIYEVLSRVQSGLEIVPPLKSPEIVNVLKKRLFENDENELRKIGREVATLIVSRGGNVVKSAITSLYKSVPEFEEKVENSYPFSPLYVELLEEQFNHLKYLQRTRDAIRITIMTLAAIYNGLYKWLSSDFYLIEPYHIPIQDSSVRSYLVNPNYDDYQILMSMYDKDVEEASRKTSNVWLSRIVGSFIWLKTIIGRGISEGNYLKLYPTTNDIILAVYDPAVFSLQNISPGTINDVLNDLYSYSNYMVKLENRYFMTQLQPIDELIKKRIRDVSEIQAYKKICDIIKEIFPLEKKKKGQVERLSRVFNEVQIVCSENKDIIQQSIKGNDHPLLLIFSYEPDYNDLDNFITRNNVVAVIPSLNMPVEDPERGKLIAKDLLISLAKELSAIESIITDINELKRLYGEEFALAKRNQLDTRAGDIRRKIIQLMQNYVFNRIIIGRPKWETKQPIGSVISGIEDSAVKAVEEILNSNSYIPPNYSFSKDEIIRLASTLGKTCKDDKEGIETICKEINLGELWSWFITTLEPPYKYVVVDFEDFLEGIRRMYEEELSIAFTYGEDFIWKDVRETKPEDPIDKGDWGKIEEFTKKYGVNIKSLKIVPWINVVQKFIDQLKAMEGVKIDDNVKKLVKIMVSYNNAFGDTIDENIDVFLQKDSWRETSRTAVFWKTVEYPEYMFSLDIVSVEVNKERIDVTNSIKVDPGQIITIKLNLDATEYPFSISVKALMNGELLQQDNIKGEEKKTVSIEVTPQNPGEHHLIIEAKGADPKNFTQQHTLILNVSGEVNKQLELNSDGIKTLLQDASYSKIVLDSVKITDMKRIIDLIRNIRAERDINIRRAEINSLNLHGLKSDKTSLAIGTGIFDSFDDLRAFLETISKVFRLESGAIKIFFEGFDSRDKILKLIDIFEKMNIEDTEYCVNAFKKIE